MMTSREIIERLPFGKSFLFVDQIEQVDDKGIVGYFSFHEELDFFKGHFADHPVTPGAILTEVMVQIGLACLGIYLNRDNVQSKHARVVLTETMTQYYKPVYPGERVRVKAEKIYYRFDKLKCKVQMTNDNKELICEGIIAGMLIKGTHET